MATMTESQRRSELAQAVAAKRPDLDLGDGAIRLVIDADPTLDVAGVVATLDEARAEHAAEEG